MAESDELFTLRQQFFTGEYAEVSSISPSEYSGATSQTAWQYKLRSLIILGQYSKAESALSSEDVDPLLKATLEAYIALAKGEDSSAFDKLIVEGKNEELTQILGSIYLVKNDRTEEAVKLLQRHENSLEAVLLLTQLFLSQGKLELAQKEVKQASGYAQDSIIYNLAEAYVNSAENGESLRGSLYFFEELSHGHPTYKTLIGDLVINLQLHQFPEAEEVLRRLSELSGSNADLLANEYAYANIKCDGEEAKAKFAELEALAPAHPVVVDFKNKNALFDSIVEKYQEQDVN